MLPTFRTSNFLFKSTFLTTASEKGGSTTAFHMFVHVCWLEALASCIFSTDDLLSAPLKMLQMVLVDTQVTKTSSNSWLNIIATATRMKFGLKVCSFPLEFVAKMRRFRWVCQRASNFGYMYWHCLMESMIWDIEQRWFWSQAWLVLWCRPLCYYAIYLSFVTEPGTPLREFVTLSHLAFMHRWCCCGGNFLIIRCKKKSGKLLAI